MSIENEVMAQQQRSRPLFTRNEDIRVTREDHQPWGNHVDLTVRLGTRISGAGAHKVRVGPYGNIITDEVV